MSTVPGTLVVGIDGLDSSARALEWGIAQAQAEHRPLTLAHAVQHVTPAYADIASEDPRVARARLEAQARQVVDDAREAVEWKDPSVELHDVLDLADPRDLLLQLSQDAAMVVVGSRGRGHARSLMLGSVGVALVRHAHCPVVVCRPEHRGTVRNGVVVGVDASEDSAPVLELAYRQAALHDLPLTVLHCVWDIAPGSAGSYLVADVVSDFDAEKLALAEAVAGMGEKYPEVTTTTRLASGRPERVLVNLADSSDLLVVGAHQRSAVRRALFGSVSLDVVEHATCPVAVVPVSASREARS